MALRVAVLVLCGLQLALGCNFCEMGMHDLHVDVSHTAFGSDLMTQLGSQISTTVQQATATMQGAQMAQASAAQQMAAMQQAELEKVQAAQEAEMQRLNAEMEAQSSRIRAEFAELTKEFTGMKQKYAFNMITEFVKLCKCGEATMGVHSAMVFETAARLNLTNSDMTYNLDITKLGTTDIPRTQEGLSRQFFGGLITEMCTSVAGYMQFLVAVQAQLQLLGPQTSAPIITGAPLS